MKLSKSRKFLLKMMLEEPNVLLKVSGERETPKIIEIEDDGSVVLYYKRPRIFARLLGSRYVKTITFETVLLRIADHMTGAQNVKNIQVFRAMCNDVLKSAMEQQNLDCAVDVVFDNLRHGEIGGSIASKWIKNEDIRHHVQNASMKIYGNLKVTEQSVDSLMPLAFSVNPYPGGQLQLCLREYR